MHYLRKSLLLILLLISAAYYAEAQTRFLVKLKNKGNSSFSLNNPTSYLSQRSIARRSRHNISLDSTDLPVTPQYINSISSVPNVVILNVSKWLNQISIQTTDANAIATINSFPFVQSATPLAARINNITTPAPSNKFAEQNGIAGEQGIQNGMADFFNYGQSYAQIRIHNGEFLHNIGLRGQGMIIGMLDAGYLNYLTVKAFDSARANGQILGTWDFVAGNASVNEDNAHGMQCFSVIGANIPGQFIGTAPKSDFYLFRTEDAATEYPIEEHNWVCGAERLDSAGGDVISSSLGYYYFDAPLSALSYTYADMNGNTTISVKGADLAAKKGVLVVNSAGNSGGNSWKYIITPADGDSVLAVGAVNTSGVVAGFSSYGPSSDGQVKPDVASVGVQTIVQFQNNAIGTNSGTSFSAPNMAGLATCLWQGFPEFNNMRIINALRKAGSISTTPNDRIGYGIPDVKKATMDLIKQFATSSGNVSGCKAMINWTSKDVAAMKYEIERKANGDANFVKVGERFGKGTVLMNHSYQFEDALTGLPVGAISYRIRQVIDTAATGLTADYIDTLSVNYESICSISDNVIMIGPNPTSTNQVTLVINTPDAADNLEIRIADGLGRRVIMINKTKSAGIATFTISIPQLAKGKYFLSVYDNGKLLGTKELLKL
jgi:hypothetical protein